MRVIQMIKEIIINPTPKVEVAKIKNGTPTVIKYGDEEYILRHKNQYKGPQKGAEK